VNWICDFGIARYLHKVLPRDQTHQNTICYTPGYVAPEARHGYATPDSDIYSIGMIFYSLFCGSEPDPNSPRIKDCPLKWFNEDAFQGSNENDPARQFIQYLTRPLGVKECWPSHPELCTKRRPDAKKALNEFGRLIVNLRELVNSMEQNVEASQKP
jgi:serine/threonine protein kinase